MAEHWGPPQKALEEANARLKRLVADLSVQNQIFKKVAGPLPNGEPLG